MSDIFQNKKIQKISKLAHTHRLLLASFIFFFLFTVSVRVFAVAWPYAPGAILDPGCTPGTANCTVIIFPDQTSNSGKFLTTNGSTVSWGSLIFSTGLTDTSGTITSNLSTGVSGGQSVVGGTASGNNLTLSSTSHATKGKIIFGTSAYDEVNNWLGIGTVTPSTKLHVLGTTEQMRLGYDASNYLSTTISSIGGVTNTITSSSGLPVFTFNKDLLVNGITVGKGKNSLSANTILGESTGASITIGNNNTMLGYNAGGANTEGSSNVFIGDSTGSYNTTGVGNTVMGSGAGVTGATNGYSVIIGLNAGYKSSSNYNVIVGFQAGAELTTGAHNNTYIGTRAGQNNLGQYNTTLGFYTGNDLTGGDTNTLIGYNTGLGIITGDKNTIIGANVTGLSAALSNNIILADGDGNRRINVNSSGYVGIGTTGQTAQLEVQANTGTGTPLVAIWGRGSGWASDIGVKGTGYQTGVYGEAAVGVWGHGPIGVYGTSSAASNVGVKGVGSNRGGEIGVYGYNGKWAGLFETSNAPEGSGASVVKILSSYSGNSDPALIVEHDGTGDLVQVFKNSTQHFTIANSGNVGLGVTAPTAYKLQIKHDANTGTGIKIENATSGTASWAGIELLPSNGAPNYVIATSQTHSSFPNELFLQNSYNGKFRFYGSASTTALFDGAGAFKYYYDNSNYLTSTVSSAGAVTFAATGASAGFSFNESILLPTTESVQFGNSSYRIDGEIGLGTVNIYTNNSKRFTVDNNGDTNLYSGNLSLGTALSINGTAPVIHLNDGNRYFDLLNDNSGNFKIKNVTAGNTIPFTVAGATDNVGINDITPDYRLDVETDSASTYVANFFNDGNNANRSGILVQAGLDDHTATGPSTLVGFQDGDGGVVGSITFGSSATAYNTTSDQRLKNLVNERTNSSLNILNQIKIHDFTWKDDLNNNLYTGVFAQELYNIYPHAVTKPINETDGWMVDYSKLTPIIVSSIQDLDLKIIGLASLDLSNSNSLGSLIKTFLSDSANTIENLYAKIIHSDRIETKELCVGATCVTETQFLQIVNGSGIISSPKTESTPEETPALDSVPDPNIETSPEPDPTPAPDQAPDSGPVIEQVPSTE